MTNHRRPTYPTPFAALAVHGPSNVTTPGVYAHLFDDDLVTAIAALGAIVQSAAEVGK